MPLSPECGIWSMVRNELCLKESNGNSNYYLKHGVNVKCLSHIRISLRFAFMIHRCVSVSSARVRKQIFII